MKFLVHSKKYRDNKNASESDNVSPLYFILSTLLLYHDLYKISFNTNKDDLGSNQFNIQALKQFTFLEEKM